MKISEIIGSALLALALVPPAAGEPIAPGSPALDPALTLEAEAAAARDRTIRKNRADEEERKRAEAQEQQDAALAAARETERTAALDLERSLSEARALEEELFRIHRNPETRDSPISPLAPAEPVKTRGWDHDPRIAAPVPAERELPSDIFDRSNEVIAPGTWQNKQEIRVVRLVLDADGDGKPERIRFLHRKGGDPIREESDRNYDGVLDAWKSYRDGEVVGRILDENDDGNPDVFETYAEGLLVIRELDRDDDGVRDVFYRYRGDSLFEEGHDANNDGVVDLRILYEDRRRVRAEEDVDRDGRMDLWTRYSEQGEKVTEIDQDRAGRGFADTFAFFQIRGEKAVLVRRERDLDGDGRIDVVSFYVDGRLWRRQIADPDLLPL